MGSQTTGRHTRRESVSLPSDRTLAYTEYGSPDGTPVLFFHGTPGSRRLAKLFDAAARSHGIRLLAFDRPGYGLSSPWPERTVRDTARVVPPVLDDAGIDTAGVVAFSGGAPYALASAATHPARIDRLDLVAGATPPRFAAEQPAVQRLLRGMATTTPRLLRAAFRVQTRVARHRDPSFVVGQYTTGDTADAVSDHVAGIVREDFLEAFANHRHGAVTEFRHAAGDWNVAFDDVDTEVRVWHGTDDTNVPLAAVRRFESELPNAELRVCDGADHLHTVLRCVPDVFAGDA